MCGFPPRPCGKFSYYVPQYFTEVVNNPGDTFFGSLPAASLQLETVTKNPWGSEDDYGAFSFHAHTINVPFTLVGFSGMPCGGEQFDHLCYSSMTEHLGRHWRTGEGDRLQPSWLAWQFSKKGCLIKDSLTSFRGGSRATGYLTIPGCSYDRSWLPRFPPSKMPVCQWGTFMFPRSGTVSHTDSTVASLVVASRLRSLGSEVFNTVSTSNDEKVGDDLPELFFLL